MADYLQLWKFVILWNFEVIECFKEFLKYIVDKIIGKMSVLEAWH